MVEPQLEALEILEVTAIMSRNCSTYQSMEKPDMRLDFQALHSAINQSLRRHNHTMQQS